MEKVEVEQGQGHNVPCASGNLESLLDFTTVASAFINSVLKKPRKSRRKVNHRKFLQKQLGAYSQYKSIFVNNTDHTQDSSGCFCYGGPCGTHDSVGTKRKLGESVTSDGLQEQSLEKLFSPNIWEDTSAGRKSRQNCSLRSRELPESFWKEPKHVEQNNAQTLSVMRTDRANGVHSDEVDTFDFLGVEFDELLEKLSRDSDVMSTSSGRCTSLSDSCSIGGKEPETPPTTVSDTSEGVSKSVFDQIWSVPADIVNPTHSDERYFF